MKRTLRLCCFSLFSCVVGVWLFTTPAHANALITVTTTADVIANDGECSLREAIIAANTDSAFHDCPSGSGADTIIFAATLAKPALFTLTKTGADENAAQCGDLDIASTLTISGTNSATIVIDGNATDRVFQVRPGANLTLTGVTIQHGNPGAMADGGGVLVDLTGRLTLTDTQVISNSALIGGGLKVLGRLTMRGGAISGNHGSGLVNDGGLVALSHVQITRNDSYGIRNQAQGALSFTTGLVDANQGIGIANATARATLDDLTVTNNTGGGLANSGATLAHLTVSHSVIMSNTAVAGGGILNEGVGAITNINSTRISSNTTTSNGGGLFNNGVMALDTSTVDHNHARAGAGVYHFGGNLSLTNATLSQNSATDNGGGLYNGSSAVLTFVTINANQAGGDGNNLFNDEAQLSIDSSILAEPAGSNCVNSNGFITSLGYNLESADTCNLHASADLVNTDPLLGPLRANGGATFTHALLPGSPATDHASSTCLATDQRDVTRPQGAACDSGAYETAAATDLAITATVAPTVTAGGDVSYTLQISNLGPVTATALTLTDEWPNGATLIVATISGGNCSTSNVVTCTLPLLAAGENATATLVVRTPASTGLLTNTASLAAVTPDVDLTNNQAVNVTAVITGADLTPPGPVGNLAATLLTAQGATLTWTPATDNVGVVGYLIYAQKVGADLAPFLVATTTATTYPLNAFTAHSSYQIWVSAYDAAGNKTPLATSASVTITTLALPVGTVQISIAPPLPTTQDAISVTIAGQHTSSCTPQYQSHQITGHLIAIVSMPSPEPFCLPAEFPWSYTLGLGLLEAGRYTVTHTLQGVVTTAFFTVTAAGPVAPRMQVDERQARMATVGALFRYVIKATGTPAPTYALLQAPTGMTLDPVSGQLTWQPTAEQTGNVTVVVQATNPLGSTTYTFQLTVQPSGNSQYRSFLPLVVKR